MTNQVNGKITIAEANDGNVSVANFLGRSKLSFSQRFTIYVPSLNREGKMLAERHLLAVLLTHRKLRRVCGGTTEV